MYNNYRVFFSICFKCFITVVLILTVNNCLSFRLYGKPRVSERSRVVTKQFKKVVAAPSPAVVSPAQPKVEVIPEVKETPVKVDEKALSEAKALRNVRNAELSRLKTDLAELKAEMKNSGQCTVDGKQITVAQFRGKISSAKALSNIGKVTKINASINDKKNVISDLEKRVNEKEETSKKMIAGTVATSTLAVAGTAGLGVAIADLVKTKMSAKKLQNGEAVCGKYGLLVK